MRYFLFACLLTHTAIFGQDSASTGLTRVTRAAIWPVGVSYETPLSKKQSFYIYPHLAFGAAVGWSSEFGFTGDISVDPVVTLHYRYYYNREARAERGKRTAHNSGNYLAAVYDLEYTKKSFTDFSEKSRRPFHTVGAVWGLQRNWPSRFSLDASGGLGYYFARGTEWDDNTNDFKTIRGSDPVFLLNASIGFWLGKRSEEGMGSR